MTPSDGQAKPHWTSLVGSTGFTALVLIVLILTVQYVGSWYGLEIVKISMEEELERHLIDQARTLEPKLATAVPELLASERSAAVENELPPEPDPIIRDSFHEFTDAARIRNLTLIDEAGSVLLSARDPDAEGRPFDFLEPDREAFESALANAPKGSLAYRGAESPLKRVYYPVRGDDGAVVGVLCLTAGRDYLVAIDRLADSLRFISTIATICVLLVAWLVYRLIARQRRYEQQAAHDDRLRSLGTLAAGFAHEVRNPLEIILACAEDVERTLKDSAEARDGAVQASVESCRDILGEVDRLNRLVGQFLQYARADAKAEVSSSAPLGESVRSAAALLGHASDKRGISIDCDEQLAPASAAVAIDEGRLRQIVLNLLMNAIQASPEGGRVRVQCEADAKSARLIVSDEGPGVPRGLRSRIFEPFFTTRDGGSGLGLAIAHQLAERAGGSLRCDDSEPSMGAKFVLELPRAISSSPVETPRWGVSPSSAPSSGGGAL